MLGLTAINARGRNKKGHSVFEYLKATEYYKSKDGHTIDLSRWTGKGAADLGLAGRHVTTEHMSQLGKGFHPITGEPLCKSAGKEAVSSVDPNTGQLIWKGGHKVGTDATLSVPKSITLAWFLGDEAERARIMAAIDKSVDRTLNHIQSRVHANRGAQGYDHKDVQALVASAHTHFSSRDLDPQLHVHCLIYGVAKADGKWSTFDPSGMFKEKMAMGALFRTELAKNMQDLGYGIRREVDRDLDGGRTGKVYFEIDGISRDLIDAFSTRRKAIEAYAKEHGVSYQTASLATRKNKDEPPLEDLEKHWHAGLDMLRKEGHEIPNTETLKALPLTNGKVVTREGHEEMDVKQIWDTLHDQQSVITKADLMLHVAQENVGRLTMDEALEKTNEILTEKNVVALKALPQKDVREYSSREKEYRFCTEEWLQAELNLVERVKARKGDEHWRMDPKKVDVAIERFRQKRGYALADDQEKSVRHVLYEGDNAVSVVQGRAGTGKSTSAEVIVDVYKEAGKTIIGAAPSWKAADVLNKETGIKSYSNAGLLRRLERGQITFHRDTVLIVDEAGMTGTRTLQRIQEFVDKAGAKVLYQGDALQLQPVEGGAGFRLISDTIGCAVLSEIRRQKSSQGRVIANAFYLDGKEPKEGERSFDWYKENGENLYQQLKDNGHVKECTDAKSAMDLLVKDYMAKEGNDKLALGFTNADVRNLNEALRTAMKERGEITGPEETITMRVNGRDSEVSVAHGDRIVFTKKDEKIGVVNGDTAMVERVERVGENRLRLTIHLDGRMGPDGKPSPIVFETGGTGRSDPRFLNGWAMTVHKSQGMGKDHVFVYSNLAMIDNQSSLVAYTRHKQSFAMYGEASELEELAKRLAMDRLARSAVEVGIEKRHQTFAPEIASNPAKHDAILKNVGLEPVVSEQQRVLQRMVDWYKQSDLKKTLDSMTKGWEAIKTPTLTERHAWLAQQTAKPVQRPIETPMEQRIEQPNVAVGNPATPSPAKPHKDTPEIGNRFRPRERGLER